MTLVKGLVEDLFEDIADVTLIDEDTKPILTIMFVCLFSQTSLMATIISLNLFL